MTADVEEARLARVPAAIRDRYDDVLATGDGARLWQCAVADLQSGHCDDRPLYWARLKLLRQQREAGRDTASAERAARGFHGAFPADVPPESRALLTGFDPFHLDRHITQSNPAGLAALALDGAILGGMRIRTAILPVRFADFDDRLVEALLTQPFEDGLGLCLTISMGRDAFDLERFPGRRRSVETPDNRNVATGASPTRPLVPAGLDGPEFLEFSLPAAAMTRVDGRWPVRDNRAVFSLERGALRAGSLAELDADTAVAGSGGGYLSNEIAYRALRLRDRLGVSFPVGHLHTPRIDGYDQALEREVVDQIRRVVIAAVAAIGPRREGG